MTSPEVRPVTPPDMVRRQNELFDHHAAWTAAHPGENPDDDPEFVDRAREIMGLPPLGDDDEKRSDPFVEYLARRIAR